jgi:hypothetical protein
VVIDGGGHTWWSKGKPYFIDRVLWALQRVQSQKFRPEKGA